MTVKTYLDLTVAPFTANGSPAKASSLHARGDTYDFDRVNDWLSSSEAVNANGATKLNFRGWLNTKRLAPTAGQSMLNSRPTSGAGNYFYVNIGNTQKLTFVAQNSTQFTNSVSSTIVPANKRVYISGSMDLAAVDIDLYINGVEVGYDTQNNAFNGGVASLNAGTLGISSDFNDSFSGGMLGSLDRLVFEDGVFWTPAQHAQFYADEVAAMVRFDECEDHLYNCNDVASPAVDSVGGSSFGLTAVNTPVFNGNTITLQRADVDRLAGPNGLIAIGGHYSGCIVGKLPVVIAAANHIIGNTDTSSGPSVQLDVSSNLIAKVFSHVTTGFALVTLDTGVLPAAASPDVTWGLAFSYDRSTKTMRARIKSSSGVNVAGSTVGSNDPVAAAGTFNFGANAGASVGCDIELDYMGFKNGIAYDDDALLAALEILVPAAEEAGDLARAICLLGAGPPRTR